MTDYSSNEPSSYAPLETNIWAIVSAVSGVLGWLGLVGFGGLVAVIAGHIAKNQIRSSGGRMGGDNLATIGLVLGYLNIGLAVVGLCLFFLVVAGVISGAAICPFIFQSGY